jgi:transcriptional regulator with XRE-family HTH domain
VPGRAKYIVPVDAKTIGKRLREIRKRRGMTQLELGQKLGMHQTLVSDYERGKLRVHGGLVVAFAKALNVTSDELLGLKEPRENGIFKDRRFLRRLQKIEKLSRSDKQALLKNLDMFLKGAGVQ